MEERNLKIKIKEKISKREEMEETKKGEKTEK